MNKKVILAILPIVSICLASAAGAANKVYDSGGKLTAEQAAYDVISYELTLYIDPQQQTIEGFATVSAWVLEPIRWLVLDLDPRLTVTKTIDVGNVDQMPTLKFERRGGKLWIDLKRQRQVREVAEVRVYYNGSPLAAPIEEGSWADGFFWSKTSQGYPWDGVVSVLNGADIWWPCKDHPSDEPERMTMNIRVPEPLVVAANGQLTGVTEHRSGTRTFHWKISTPINNYGVTINAAPYRTITGTYQSIGGSQVPLTFWVLPDHYRQGLKLFPQFSQHLRFLEETLGPYPFRADKYGVAETPYLGMEHQTIISYGAKFSDNKYGFDQLHFHELAHEWWANQVTAADWKDWWLHEGFATYMGALYAETLKGIDAYHESMAARKSFTNEKPVAPRLTQTTRDIYSGEIYAKGAWILHTLRFLIGKEALLESFRRTTYPDPEDEKITDGSHCRLVDSDDFLNTVESVSTAELKWFFDVYLHQPQLPELITNIENGSMTLLWDAPDGLPFPMPIEVKIGDRIERVEMPEGVASISIPAGITPQVDPHDWVLRKKP